MEYNWLEEARGKLDEIDFQLVDILVERYKIVRKIGEYKKKENIPVMQFERLSKILKRCSEKGTSYGMNEDFIRKLFNLIIEESCKIEESIMNNSEG